MKKETISIPETSITNTAATEPRKTPFQIAEERFLQMMGFAQEVNFSTPSATVVGDDAA